jgi:hypothetical protein
MQALETLNTLNKTRLVKLSLIFKVHYNIIKRCTRYIKVDLGFFFCGQNFLNYPEKKQY